MGDLETTRDTILDGKVTLHQPKEGYRVAVDPILLAATVPPEASGMLVDLGAGSGAVSLSVAYRCPGLRVVGVEIDPATAGLAARNTDENGMSDRVRILVADIRETVGHLGLGSADLVIANPPYLPAARSDPSPNPGRKRSDVESTATLTDWINAAAAVLRPKGRMTLVHRADRLEEIVSALADRFGEVTVHPLWPKAGRDAKRVLVSARLGVRSPSRMTAGTVLHEPDGTYSTVMKGILGGDHLPLF